MVDPSTALRAGPALYVGRLRHRRFSPRDMVALLRLAVRNSHAFNQLNGRWSWLNRQLPTVAHSFRANTKDGSRRNIAAHYDLGNEFFRLFLDADSISLCTC